MDIDGSSLAAAALYDLKNEQLQLANAALQQQGAGERSQQETSTEGKQQETTTDESVTTTTEGHHFGEEGTKKNSLD
jgi:hypothetical protein